MPAGQHDVMGYGVRRDGRRKHRHSRIPPVIPAKAGIWMRAPTTSVDVGAVLRRLPRRPGAQDRGACSDEEAAGKEEQEQQAAGDAGAASSGELVRRNGRRGGRGRRRGDRRASWGHRWRGRGSGRPGRHDVIRARSGGPRCARSWSASRRLRCLRCPCLRGCLRSRCLRRRRASRWRGCLRRRRASRWRGCLRRRRASRWRGCLRRRRASRWRGCLRRRRASRLSPGWPRWWRPGAGDRSWRQGRRCRRRW